MGVACFWSELSVFRGFTQSLFFGGAHRAHGTGRDMFLHLCTNDILKTKHGLSVGHPEVLTLHKYINSTQKFRERQQQNVPRQNKFELGLSLGNFFFFFLLFRGAPKACGGSQARG